MGLSAGPGTTPLHLVPGSNGHSFPQLSNERSVSSLINSTHPHLAFTNSVRPFSNTFTDTSLSAAPAPASDPYCFNNSEGTPVRMDNFSNAMVPKLESDFTSPADDTNIETTMPLSFSQTYSGVFNAVEFFSDRLVTSFPPPKIHSEIPAEANAMTTLNEMTNNARCWKTEPPPSI